MMYTFKSCFASQIEDFIAQKNALGFGYLESSRLLRDFDRFCLTHFPEENTLTKELCLAWATKKDTEGNNTFRNRMMPVREFARYLNRNGEAAYILPPDIARKDAPYAPYIYTEAEILAIWNILDHLTPRVSFPVRHFVIPAMVKLLYCCGLRPAEVRRLRVRDVDLDKGRLNIMESKQHRSRIVMMADDVTKMLSDCNAVVTSAMPEREPFFPNSEGGFYGKRGLEKTFRLVLKKAGVTGTGRRSPRLYDFRHPYVKHTTKIFSLRLMDFQAQAYPDARRKTRGACQLLRVGQSKSLVRLLCNRKQFSCLPPQSKISRILYAISIRLSGYTSTRSISISASSVVSASASKIALDASFRLSCRACSSCFCFACANTAA